MMGILTDSERAAWISGDRVARYRERADHLKGMANAETRPRERAHVLELAVASSAWRTNWPAKRRDGAEPLRRRRSG